MRKKAAETQPFVLYCMQSVQCKYIEVLQMRFEPLTNDNVEKYITYLKKALREDPEQMWVDSVDEKEIIDRVNDPFYQNTKSILALLDDETIGRIEYHFYGCVQDGYKMAYVDWVYVLKGHRNKGVAKALFHEFEKDCQKHKINQYFLIRASNDSANHFYSRFENADLSDVPMLRKDILSDSVSM